MTARIIIHTVTAGGTRRLGQLIGEAARPGDVYLLTGPLGAGKTCLTQGIARGLGVDGYARSPTFVLATRYRGRLTLHHADLYRIDHPAEAWDLGLEDVMSAGEDVLVVEWADRAAAIFPADALWIDLDYAAGDRARPSDGDTPPDGSDNPDLDNPAPDSLDDDDGSLPAPRRVVIAGAPARFAGLLERLAAAPAAGTE